MGGDGRGSGRIRRVEGTRSPRRLKHRRVPSCVRSLDHILLHDDSANLNLIRKKKLVKHRTGPLSLVNRLKAHRTFLTFATLPTLCSITARCVSVTRRRVWPVITGGRNVRMRRVQPTRSISNCLIRNVLFHPYQGRWNVLEENF